MRVYNKWYKELWWFLVENKQMVVIIMLGIMLGLLSGYLLVLLLEG
jgi:hypothetical protein